MAKGEHLRTEVIQEVEIAFANIAYPGDERLVTNLSHYEADDVIQDFKGKHWRDIALKLVYRHRLSLPLFTPEAFRFYLPAFLVVPLRTPIGAEYSAGEILEFVFYSLVPPNGESHDMGRFLSRVNGFTAQQEASIRKFIRLFLETNLHHAEVYGESAKKFWKV